jgi:hypothetical protein
VLLTAAPSLVAMVYAYSTFVNCRAEGSCCANGVAANSCASCVAAAVSVAFGCAPSDPAHAELIPDAKAVEAIRATGAMAIAKTRTPFLIILIILFSFVGTTWPIMA